VREADAELELLEVDVGTAEPEDLALPEPQVERQGVDPAVLARNALEQPGRLRNGQCGALGGP